MSKQQYHDILSFIFDCQLGTDDKKPIFIDGEDPNYALTALEAQQLTQDMISSLREQGVQKADRVVVHLPNSVSIVMFNEQSLHSERRYRLQYLP